MKPYNLYDIKSKGHATIFLKIVDASPFLGFTKPGAYSFMESGIKTCKRAINETRLIETCDNQTLRFISNRFLIHFSLLKSYVQIIILIYRKKLNSF